MGVAVADCYHLAYGFPRTIFYHHNREGNFEVHELAQMEGSYLCFDGG